MYWAKGNRASMETIQYDAPLNVWSYISVLCIGIYMNDVQSKSIFRATIEMFSRVSNWQPNCFASAVFFFPSDEHFWIGIMDSGSIGNLRNGGREPATSIQHASRRKNVRELLTLRYFTAIHATNARLIALNFYYITTSNDWCCWLTRWNWKHRIPRGSWWCCRKIEESHRITFICLLELP